MNKHHHAVLLEKVFYGLLLCLLCFYSACSESDGTSLGGSGSEGSTSDDGDHNSRNGNGNGSFHASEEIAVDVTPKSVGFGAVLLGDAQEKTLELLHTGAGGTLEFELSLETTGDDISLVSPDKSQLGPGESTVILLRYAPTDAIHDTGVLRIETNAPSVGDGFVVFEVPIDTIPLSSELQVDTYVLNFSTVPTGHTKVESVTLLNLGTLDVLITELKLEEDSSLDFSIVEGLELPMTLAPGGLANVALAYTPTGQDMDTGALSCAYEAADKNDEAVVALTGQEISAQLVVNPDPLDFGMHPPGAKVMESIVVSNEGDADLEITEIVMGETGLWHQTVKLETVLDEAVVLPVGESITLELSFTPTYDMVVSGEPLTNLIFMSNDPTGGGSVLLPVYGQRLGGGLEVYPPDILYFGYVGVSGTVRRKVSLYNAGNAPVTVSQVHVEGEFKLDDPDAWGPTQANAVADIIAPGETRTVWTKHTNPGGLMETIWGKLVIDSDDDLKPVWEVLLNAQKVEGAECLIQFNPSSHDYGLLTPTMQSVFEVELVNIGAQACEFHSAFVDACADSIICGVSDDEAMEDGDSELFAVTTVPTPEASTLPPGESLLLDVTFTAPSAGEQIVTYEAMLRARVSSINPETGASEITVHPSSESWLQIPNLTASVGVGKLEVDPPSLDFGLTLLGCQSEPRTLTATNVGQADLTVDGWSLLGCDGTMWMISAPADDASTLLHPMESLTFEMAYIPADEIENLCALEIWSSDKEDPTVVSLSGLGSYLGEVTDVFTDSATQKVDVLFVVDDSGSMNEEQYNLAQSFDAFIQEAASWHSDYQIGVTTTTVQFPISGLLQGPPAYVTQSNWEKFIPNVEVGTSGSGDEQGLWAAKIALSPPLTDETDEVCVEDEDCSFLHLCTEGLCGGGNMGFIREDAALELVFVSDEEDHSPDELEEYLNFFRELKGFDHPELLHIHAIVGPPGGCGSTNGNAEAGHRYMNLSDATGGVKYSICELDFAKGLEGIGEVAFATQMEYFLSEIADPTTIDVTIDGLPCPLFSAGIFNWSYDPEHNSVQLTESGICRAEPGQIVEIYYQLLCYEEVDGDAEPLSP